MKIKNKSKFIRSIVIILGIIIILSLITSKSLSHAEKEYKTICVESGDTLWSIAQRYNTKNRDIRYVVDDIMRANDLDSTRLHVGDTLVIPAR